MTIAVGSDTYLVETFPMPATPGTSPLPLDVAIDKQAGNTIYMVPEFDNAIYSVARTATNGTTMTAIPILAPSSPIFRSTLAGADVPSFFSFQQEKIMTTSDGSVWVSQGGLILYGGSGNNWSRIMRRKSDLTWEAYTLPVDGAGATGFFVNDPPTLLFVMAAGDASFYVTRIRGWHEAELVATRYPPVDFRWTKIAGFGVGAQLSFPAQVTRLKDRRLAGTLYFGTAFFLYDPITGVFTIVNLTAAPAGATLGSSGPWQIVQDASENIWIAEDYAQRVTKYNIFTGVQTVFDLSASLSADEHPHSLVVDGTDILITTYPNATNGNGRLVKITSGGVVSIGTSFATISLEGGLTGIAKDSAGALWVALFRKTSVARLTKQ